MYKKFLCDKLYVAGKCIQVKNKGALLWHYMCISDNNGSFIIFDSNLYKFGVLVPKIKTLLIK